MTAIAKFLSGARGAAAVMLALTAIAALAPTSRYCAFADQSQTPVVVLKEPIAGDMPNISPPARVVVYSSGLVIFRPKHSQPITATSTTLDYKSVQLSPAQYADLMGSLPLKQAYRQQSWVNTMMPEILTFNHGVHGLGVEAANFTSLYAQPSAQARFTVYHILDTFRPPDAAVYTAKTYTMRLYPTTGKYTHGPYAIWPKNWSDIALPADAAKGAPRTDRRYIATISGPQYNRVQGLLDQSGVNTGLVSIDGKLWLLEFTPNLPGAAAWGGDEQEDFLIFRDAIHGDIPDDYADW